LRERPARASETGIVTALSHDGEGIVPAGKTAFVAGALPGERVQFLRRRRHAHHDEAELEAVLEPSALRITPHCPHFGVCGGCALQHLDGAAQISAKQQQVREALERIGKVKPEQWLEPITGALWAYRRRARLGARFVTKKDFAALGFRERYSSMVARIGSCAVLGAPVGNLIEPLAALIKSLSIRERLPQIEVAIGEGAVVLVVRVLSPPTAEDQAKLLAFEQAHGVRLYLQPGNLTTVRPLAGEPAQLEYTLPEFDVRIAFEPTDFVQVHAEVNRALISRVVSLLALDRDAQVLDLYCGLGNFSLPLARRAATVVGVEGEAQLIERARANALRNGLANAQFLAADLSLATAQPPWPARAYTHVLLDPPRAGALNVLPALAKLAPKRLVYVSCHPGTLARDLAVLVHQHGFRLLAAGVADMFPHTAHVESVAVLASD
jgi:23S rRNA (uracil1939-C5)-methyltransferase